METHSARRDFLFASDCFFSMVVDHALFDTVKRLICTTEATQSWVKLREKDISTAIDVIY